MVNNDIELDYGAITIDNCTFKSLGYKFNEGLLSKISQFKDSPVTFLQTDIVHNEAIKHLSKEIEEARKSIEKAIRSATIHLKIDESNIDNARNSLTVNGDDKEIAKSRLNEFYLNTSCEILKAEKYLNISTLMEIYFCTQAPFETNSKKKNEFPDAIALLTLEAWAVKNDTNVIAVSEDKGWIEFSENSENITIIQSLPDALQKFQQQNIVIKIIKKIRNDLLFEQNNHFLNSLEESLIDNVNHTDFIDFNADSAFHFDWDDMEISYLEHELMLNNDNLVDIQVISINSNEIVLNVTANIEVSVSASFDFYVKDSIDKDYVGIGSNICHANEEYMSDILVTLSGDFLNSEDFEVADIEIIETLTYVDFGYIEPDWRDFD